MGGWWARASGARRGAAVGLIVGAINILAELSGKSDGARAAYASVEGAANLAGVVVGSVLACAIVGALVWRKQAGG